MLQRTETIFCKNCGVEIHGAPIIENDCVYCCLDCIHQSPCECAALIELEEDRTSERNSVISLLAAYAD
jgi:hypothetical protein